MIEIKFQVSVRGTAKENCLTQDLCIHYSIELNSLNLNKWPFRDIQTGRPTDPQIALHYITLTWFNIIVTLKHGSEVTQDH